MPAQAKIKVNGVVGTNTDVAVNVLVDLDNQNAGGEASFLWAILDQPPGAADLLSATNVQAPTFTPRKEGSYLIKLIVNLGGSDEVSDTQVVAVRQLKTGQRVPAAGETTQIDAVTGWAGKASNGSAGVDAWLRLLDQLRGDPGLWIGVRTGGVWARGQVVHVSGTTKIKTGLPGEETLPVFATAGATAAVNMRGTLLVIDQGVDGSTSGADGALVLARTFGRMGPISLVGPSVGDPIYVSDDGVLKPTTPGTFYRRVGTVIAVNGGANTYDALIDTTGTGAVRAAQLVFGAAQQTQPGVTEFLGPGYVDNEASAAEVAIPLSAPGWLRRFRVSAPTWQTGDAIQLAVRVNGVDTTLVLLIAAGGPPGSTATDDVHNVQVGDGALVSVRITAGGGQVTSVGQLVATVDHYRED